MPGAAGLLLPAFAHPASGYGALLLPAFLAWGIGLGMLTPAVVAVAVGAARGERAGLASAVNNTARQAGGATGVAVAGAVAGAPGSAGFVTRMHTVAAAGAALYLALAFINALMKGRQADRTGPEPDQVSSTNSAEP